MFSFYVTKHWWLFEKKKNCSHTHMHMTNLKHIVLDSIGILLISFTANYERDALPLYWIFSFTSNANLLHNIDLKYHLLYKQQPVSLSIYCCRAKKFLIFHLSHATSFLTFKQSQGENPLNTQLRHEKHTLI